MKKLFLAAAILTAAALTGCANDDILMKQDLSYMSRNEVVTAINDCEGSGTRANVVYTRAFWRGKMVPVPVDVQCTPMPAKRRVE